MIPAAVDRAIVEVRDGPLLLGTGFVVSADGHVLTAKHVTGARTTITIVFLEGNTDTAQFVESGPTAADDWAVFRLDHRPAPVEPIPLGNIQSVATQVIWHTVGFANLRANQRGGFHGGVRREVPNLELFCEELIGRTYDDARGMSGAPCIVDGEAVALIVDVLHENGTGAIVTGQVEAIPLANIRPACAALAPQPGGPLPWELVFTSPLQTVTDADRQMAAEIARLSPRIGPRLPHQIARRMINQGIDTTAKVMKQISHVGHQMIEEIMLMADTLWVRGAAAESFAQITDTNGVGWISTEQDWCAVHHLQRAYACRSQTRFAWKYVVVKGAYVEPIPDTVLRKTFDELRLLLPGSDDDVRRKAAKQACVTVFIVGTPRNDVVAKLRQEFPSLVIIFMSRAQQAGAGVAPTGLRRVLPPTEPAEERLAAQCNDDARGFL